MPHATPPPHENFSACVQSPNTQGTSETAAKSSTLYIPLHCSGQYYCCDHTKCMSRFDATPTWRMFCEILKRERKCDFGRQGLKRTSFLEKQLQNTFFFQNRNFHSLNFFSKHVSRKKSLTLSEIFPRNTRKSTSSKGHETSETKANSWQPFWLIQEKLEPQKEMTFPYLLKVKVTADVLTWFKVKIDLKNGLSRGF